ncbi:type II toxin-antitoxin system RelE/ParE family toxin [Methyloraptor flagellatus]|uniref:Type II toxin-antitoxin system RelE/ParE family toxin n=1 Tax=Methyloraptor flagellatus TaxID=3162530 RepID=A0AAU7XFJ8_9HYPH
MAALPLVFAALAIDDLDQIALAIAVDSPRRARTFVAELRAKCSVIAENPAAYPLREEFGAGVRLTMHGRYIIFHAIRDERVVIERILHGARDLESINLG